MGTHKKTFRNIALLVIFVMLVICSILSFSYAYYTSSATSNPTFAVHNTSVDCLSITPGSGDYQTITSLPAYLYPVSDTYAKTTASLISKAFGQVSMVVINNCSSAVDFDILFIPDSNNQINQSYIRYAICEHTFSSNTISECWNPGNNSYYGTARTLGNSSTCYSASDSGFWTYMASTSIGGNALGGSDARMCSLTRQESSSGYHIEATQIMRYITIRYWLNETTPLAQYNNKRLSGKFVVYGY